MKDIWDILSSLTPLIIGTGVTGIAAVFTHIYNFRQLQLAQIEALDKFRPLLTSPSPAEREFAYASFAALGYEELALRIIGLSKDASGLAVAEQLQESPKATVRASAQTALQELSKVDEFINKFEGTTEGSPPGVRSRALAQAESLGLNTELAIAVLEDTMTQHGSIARYVSAANEEMKGSPKDGVSEKEWLLSFLKARLEKTNPAMRRYVERRLGELRTLVENEDWTLSSIG